jgi:uncharacterized protein DUF3307
VKSPTDRLLWGILAHLGADWLLQNAYMADNKATLGHPAGILHAAIHTLALAAVFPRRVALFLGIVHYLIDLRFLLRWWRETFRQTTTGPAALHVAIWQDQVCHMLTLAVAARIVASSDKRHASDKRCKSRRSDAECQLCRSVYSNHTCAPTALRETPQNPVSSRGNGVKHVRLLRELLGSLFDYRFCRR